MNERKTRICVDCKCSFDKSGFSRAQWKRKVDSTCLNCTAKRVEARSFVNNSKRVLNASSSTFVPQTAAVVEPRLLTDNSTALSPLDVLIGVFDERFTTDELLEALEVNFYDVELTVRALSRLFDQTNDEETQLTALISLIEQADDDSHTQQTRSNRPISMREKLVEIEGNERNGSNVPGAKEKEVCKFFLMGVCRVVNCNFRHTKDVACKFWLREGSCMRGDQCRFIHDMRPDLVPKVLSNVSKSQQQQRKPAVSIPTKAAAVSTVQSANSAAVPASGPMTMAEKLNLRALQEAFPWVRPQVAEQVFNANGRSHDGAASYLSLFHPPSAAYLEQKALEESEKAEALAAEQANLQRSAARRREQAVAWAETGDQVSKLYNHYRSEAIEHAQKRNQMFELSAQAFMRGDGKGAKELSRKGRLHQQKMKELHQKAADAIYAARNANSSEVMDCHGLHVNETLQRLAQRIEEAKNARGGGHFFVLLGTGHHSDQNALKHAKLKPAVDKFLTERRDCYVVDASADGRGGCLSVTVK